MGRDIPAIDKNYLTERNDLHGDRLGSWGLHCSCGIVAIS